MHEKIYPESKWERLISEEREKNLNRERFFEISQPNKNEVWADIGCGPGYFTLPLAQKVLKVFAVDISENMLKICQSRAEKAGIQNISYVKSSGDSFNLELDSIDKVLLVNVLHEFNDLKKAILEINRILHVGGLAYIIDWKYQPMEFGPPLEHRLPEQKVVQSFLESGFEKKGSWDIYSYSYVLAFQKKETLS